VLGTGVAPDGTSSGVKRFEVDIVHGFANLTSERFVSLLEGLDTMATFATSSSIRIASEPPPFPP
jgi:hypothetical protein